MMSVVRTGIAARKTWSLFFMVMLVASLAPLPALADIEIEKYMNVGQQESLLNRQIRLIATDPNAETCSVEVWNPQTGQKTVVDLEPDEEQSLEGLELRVKKSKYIEQYRCKVEIEAETSGSSGSSGYDDDNEFDDDYEKQKPVSISGQPGSLVHGIGGAGVSSGSSGGGSGASVIPLLPREAVRTEGRNTLRETGAIDFTVDDASDLPVVFINEAHVTRAGEQLFPALRIHNRGSNPTGFATNVMVAVSQEPAFMKLQAFSRV